MSANEVELRGRMHELLTLRNGKTEGLPKGVLPATDSDSSGMPNGGPRSIQGLESSHWTKVQTLLTLRLLVQLGCLLWWHCSGLLNSKIGEIGGSSQTRLRFAMERNAQLMAKEKMGNARRRLEVIQQCGVRARHRMFPQMWG